ncbi:hypothetical protein Bhyg_12483 [Pseudolycoriella hygida]|uniref:Uncharacterized protein n=1 Tax=Pseudolycoriella hygida TaxID=35572 RepID=A0A9Q0S0X0_9DIPT|nr:hypothetical protein Bhyg_12483 [Pseudolycoriella hygida]
MNNSSALSELKKVLGLKDMTKEQEVSLANYRVSRK